MTNNNVTFPSDHTADEWRKMAAESRQRSADSFERSDTDGYVSQWASDLTGRLYSLAAEVAEQGNTWEFDVPFIDGLPATDWAWVETRYGSTVRIGRGSDVRWWNPSAARKGATRLANDTKKGVVWGNVRTEAVVVMAGSGTGMAGALSVRPVVQRKIGAALEVVGLSDRYTRND
jgi:hypothetical protein